jgi:hypothetical protein
LSVRELRLEKQLFNWYRLLLFAVRETEDVRPPTRSNRP